MDGSEQNKTGTITGSRALVDALLREGIDHVFGIPGTQNLAFLDALNGQLVDFEGPITGKKSP